MPDPGASLVFAVLAELAGVFNQHRRTLRLTTPAGDDVLLAESLRGEEEISRGFRLQVSALSQDAGIPLKSLLGQPVLVELLTAGAVARPFHGYVTAVELAGANGGFARYHLTVEPWTAFLRVGRDSRVFQDQTVLEILDTVFKAYEGKGKLMPAWRFDVRERDVYPERSLTTQYQESDLAFAERLMSEEGLFYFFEHEGDPDSAGYGQHTLVIADHNGAFKPNEQVNVRFTQPGAVMKEDSIDRWRTELRLRTNAVELTSWDYRSRSTRDVSSAAQEEVSLTRRDVPGVYAYQSRAQGERMAENQLQALQAKKEVHVGAGTVRTLSAGTRFRLQGHSRYNSEFVIVRVCHMAHNNLQADTDSALTRTLGECAIKAANVAELGASLHAARRGAGERPVYRNRIDAIPSDVPYRSASLHARPTVHGQQTAIVVGPVGSVIHTDRDHRIKVQFHWQRGDSSHNRLAHPSPDGHTGAPADDAAGTWVRVATPLAPVAGANWGSNALPRVGQEVLVDFFEGNIDRPVVIGALYNGAGQTDAQNNKAAFGAGAATGNAPAWFPGQAGAHAHPAALSGIKSQAMQSSQSGAGAYSQLVMDDSADEARIALQRHATAHQGTAELNLGHLRHQTDNQRLQPAGFGAELKTEHSTALRAGSGMLLSADRTTTGSAQLDSRPAAGQIEQAAQLHTSLAETAQKHNARLAGEEAAEKLPAIGHVKRSAEVVSGIGGDGSGSHGGSGSATEYSAAQLQLSAPSGIAALTPASAVITAGATSAIGAGQDINFAAQGGSFHVVRAGISLFTYGKATNAGKPNQETGIRLHAASGKVSSQSQSGPTRLAADKGVTVASVTKSVNVAAREHVLLTAQGAFLKLEGGNIMLHGPGKIEFKASMKELAGPERSEVAKVTFPNSILNYKVKKGYRFSR
jgi:type VI secretion system secreted protein VgrG